VVRKCDFLTVSGRLFLQVSAETQLKERRSKFVFNNGI